ncbi:unnamed protein product [Phytophthora fragariaefolia]|uniref:Unnamed protein product n=1 Tax=Phytophthora fragariaefolia TaxID=1490495 RepID=A0A9W6XZ68_9STRA|nr:unnamed protein product [Phytophthora fragariaefolia]
MMNWSRLRDHLDHLESGTQVPAEWLTVITVMANDTRFPSSAVRPDGPPPDDEDEQTKDSEPPTAHSFLYLSRGASIVGRSLGKRKSTPSPPRSHKKAPPAEIEEVPTGWVGAPDSPCRPEGIPYHYLRLKRELAWRTVPWCLHTSFHLNDLTVMLLSMMRWNHLDSTPWTKYVPRRYLTVALVALEGLMGAWEDIPDWRVTPGPAPDDAEFELLDEEEVDDETEKDEDYVSQQHSDDGENNDDEELGEALDDSVLYIAERTSKRRRLSQPPAEVPTLKNVKSMTPPKTKGNIKSEAESKSGSKSKSGSNITTVLAAKWPQHLESDECRIIETACPGVVSRLYFGVRVKPGDPTTHAPFQTTGFPDFVLNRHDHEILKERCDGEELKVFLATRPWTKLSDTRRTEFFFHRRADLGHEVVRALEDWVNFMKENVEALWLATHWIALDRDSSSKFTRKTSVQRLKLHESVRKKVLAKEKQLKKIAPASVWNAPGLWKFPKRICYWVLMNRSHTKPGTDARYSLKELVDLLDAREPARLQWGACSSDEERIDHLPEDVRRKLISSGQRDYLDD